MLADFISLFFPKYCVACKEGLSRNEKLICLACAAQMPKTKGHLDHDNFILKKFYGKVRVHHAVARYYFNQSGRVQQVLHYLKYKNRPEIGVLLGQQYGLELKKNKDMLNYSIITAVPLHKAKLRHRGYNQSECFGQGLSETMEIEYKNTLFRRKNTATQTKKSRLERWENVSSMFDVVDTGLVRGQRILLVDDVITTGATAEACLNRLVEAGAKEVAFAAIAAAK